MLFLFVFFLPETYAPFLLKSRAAKLRKEHSNDNIRTEQELFRRPVSELLQESLVRPFSMPHSIYACLAKASGLILLSAVLIVTEPMYDRFFGCFVGPSLTLLQSGPVLELRSPHLWLAVQLLLRLSSHL